MLNNMLICIISSMPANFIIINRLTTSLFFHKVIVLLEYIDTLNDMHGEDSPVSAIMLGLCLKLSGTRGTYYAKDYTGIFGVSLMGRQRSPVKK